MDSGQDSFDQDASGLIPGVPPGLLAGLAEQIDMALREAERYDGVFYPSGDRMGFSDHCKERAGYVMTAHRAMYEMPNVDDLVLAYGDEESPYGLDNPLHQGGVFGVLAASAWGLHVLRPGYCSPEEMALLALRNPPRQSLGCDWGSRGCANYSKEILMIAQGQYIVFFLTCPFCKDWLTRQGQLLVERGADGYAA